MCESRYVYGVVRADTPPPMGVVGIGGARLDMVEWSGLAAVTSEISSPVAVTTANVLAHQAVVESLRTLGPALPARFGTVLPDRHALCRAIEGSHQCLLEDLARIGDKVELGVTVLASEAAVEVVRESESALETRSRGAGVQYLLGRAAALRRAERMRTDAAMLVVELRETFAPLTLAERHVLLPTSRILVRATYLAEPAEVAAFGALFTRARRAHGEHRLVLSGPWPPYSFVSRSEGCVRANRTTQSFSALAEQLVQQI
jgi:hypothetical protein